MTRKRTPPRTIPEIVTFPSRTKLQIPGYLTTAMKEYFAEIEAEMVKAGVKLIAFDAALIAVFAGFLDCMEREWKRLRAGESTYPEMAAQLLEAHRYGEMLMLDKEALGRLMHGWTE